MGGVTTPPIVLFLPPLRDVSPSTRSAPSDSYGSTRPIRAQAMLAA
jgi:hypothetical protein